MNLLQYLHVMFSCCENVDIKIVLVLTDVVLHDYLFYLSF